MEVEKINKKIGINVKAEKIADLLSIMCLQSVVDDDNKHIKVTIPPTRAGKQEPRTNCVSTTKNYYYKYWNQLKLFLITITILQVLASIKKF